MRERTTASRGARRSRVGELLLEERRLRLLAVEQRFGLRDVFLAWPDQRQLAAPCD